MLGLAHNQIVAMGTAYLSRGYITIDSSRTCEVSIPALSSLRRPWDRREVMDAVDRLHIHFPDTRRKDKRFVSQIDLQHL